MLEKIMTIAMQDTLHSNDVSNALRERIMAFYRYKYRNGKILLQEQVMGELPYDMQVHSVKANPSTLALLQLATL